MLSMTLPRRLWLTAAFVLAAALALPMFSAATPARAAASLPCDIYAAGGTPCEAAYSTTRALFKYTVNVATAGTYTVGLRVSSPSGVTDGLHIANSSGTNLSGSVNVPATGAWQTWTTVNATVNLPAGKQTLTVDQDNGGWDMHQLTFASSSSSGGSCGELTANVPLTANQSLASCNGEYALIMQGDGNLVLYTSSGAPVWASNTAGNSGAYLEVQNDGSVVIYSASGSVLWSTGTAGK